MKHITLLLSLVLSGCASDFEKLIDDVKDNCHTIIDAQVNGGVTGLGGAGHFQQECWPINPVNGVPK